MISRLGAGPLRETKISQRLSRGDFGSRQGEKMFSNAVVPSCGSEPQRGRNTHGDCYLTVEDPACRNVPGHPHRHHPLQRHHPHRLQVLGGPRYAFCLPFVLHWRGPVEHVAPSMAACSRLREQPEPYSLPGVCLPWQSRCRPTPTPRSSPTRASAVTFPATTPPLSPPPMTTTLRDPRARHHREDQVEISLWASSRFHLTHA